MSPIEAATTIGGSTPAATAAALLAELATGKLALTHAALNARGAGQTTTYLRGLLVAAGVLPDEDAVVVDFERWLHRRLATLDDHPYRQVLRQFGLWHQLPRMRDKASRRRLPAGAGLYARGQFKAAQSFLTWLVESGPELADAGQADLDRWFTEARRGDRDRCRGFLSWAMSTGRMSMGELPSQEAPTGPGMTQRERLDLLRTRVGDLHHPVAGRAAAALVLLFAQPLTRIRTRTIDDVIGGGGEVAIRLGEPPSPVPQPFAALLLEVRANRGI